MAALPPCRPHRVGDDLVRGRELLVGVCAVEALTGLSLWRGERRGAIVGLATTPLAAGLGLGFALPFYLVSIPMRLGLLALGRRTLR